MHGKKKTRRHAAVLARLLPKITADDVPPIVHELLDLSPSQLFVVLRVYRALKNSTKPENSDKLVSRLPLVWDIEGAKRRAGPRSKLTHEQTVKIKKLREQNPKVYSLRRLAEKFKVSAPTIAHALRRLGK